MAAQWADYVITKVHYESNGYKYRRIAQVHVRTDNGTSLGGQSTWNRQDVVNTIKQGETFVTAYLVNGQFQKGARVEVVTINGTDYIRTDSNHREEDNLGELPEF